MGGCRSAAEDDGMTRDALQPLTQFRQQHRRTIDGRLCAAAFVQDRHAFTGCASSRDPTGGSGRPWCYVEPQLLDGSVRSWNYCAPVVDYDAMRVAPAADTARKVAEVRQLVAKLCAGLPGAYLSLARLY